MFFFSSDFLNCIGICYLRDDREEMNVNKADNAFDLSAAGLEQNEGWFSLDFVRTGFGAESKLRTQATRALQFELEKSAAGSVPVIIEAIEQVAIPQATA